MSIILLSVSFQAERLMEALELYKEESAKLKAHAAECKSTGKDVSHFW